MTVIKPNTFKTISLLRIYKTTSASGRPHFARVNKFATTNFCDLINPDQFCYHNYTKTTGSRRNNIRNDKVLANLAKISRTRNKGYSIPTFCQAYNSSALSLQLPCSFFPYTFFILQYVLLHKCTIRNVNYNYFPNNWMDLIYIYITKTQKGPPKLSIPIF